MSVTLAFLGDVMLGRGVNDEIAKRPPESFWGDLLPVLRSADAVIANLEVALTPHRQPWWRTPKVFHFRADPRAIEVLKAARIRAVSLANNHSLDFEETGLLDTLRILDEAGIAHAGAGRNLAEARDPSLFEAAGLTLGMLAMTDNEPAFAAQADRPGTQYWDIARDPAALAIVEEQATSLRRRGAQIVILSLHWGPNMVEEPPVEFQEFAHGALDRGVDIIHGHSAHVFQAVEPYSRGLILYDTGDFLDDYAVDPNLRNDWSFVFLVELDAGRLRRCRMIPARLEYARVRRATGSEFEAIRERMRARCKAFNVPLTDSDEGLVLNLE